MNANAFFRKDSPLEMVLESEVIAYPVTKFMCSMNVDGTAAAALMRGNAGARQIADARIGMAHVVGLGTTAAVHIIEKS